jgi:hypothetical protein
MRHQQRYAEFIEALQRKRRDDYDAEMLYFADFKNMVVEQLPNNSFVRRWILLEPDLLPRRVMTEKMLLILELHEKLKNNGLNLFEM